MRNGYAFSDGNGVMGIAVAQSIQASMRLKILPGAVQIRMGGVKGMLSLKLDFEAKSIGIRPSQVKFRSSHRVLEVKKVATVGDNTNKLFKETLLVSCQCQRCFIFIKLLLYLCSLLLFLYYQGYGSSRHIVFNILQTTRASMRSNVVKV